MQVGDAQAGLDHRAQAIAAYEYALAPFDPGSPDQAAEARKALAKLRGN